MRGINKVIKMHPLGTINVSYMNNFSLDQSGGLIDLPAPTSMIFLNVHINSNINVEDLFSRNDRY